MSFAFNPFTGNLDTVTGGGGSSLSSMDYEIDEASDTVTYIGKADPGTATSAASWQIVRVTRVDDDYSRELADGDTDFDNIWDDRASLSYS